MGILRTNRDLYLAIENLVQKYSASERSLEVYLRAMLAESNRYRESRALSAVDFYDLLERSFFSQPAEFEAGVARAL